MVSAFAASFAALFLAMTSLELFSFLESQSDACTTTTSAHQAPLVDTAAAEVLPAAAAGALFIAAIAFMYHRLSCHPAAVPVAGGAANNRRLPGLVTFILCVSTGMLEYILFVRTAAGGGAADHGAQAARRALGLAARHALPAAATATFFLGMALVIVAHVRAGGEGGGGAVAGDEPVRAAVRVLTRIAVGAAAGLTFLMGMAFFYNAK